MPATRIELPTAYLKRPKREAAVPSAQAKGVVIGARYNGRHRMVSDENTGDYWEALPAIQGDAVRVQEALLAPLPEERTAALISGFFGAFITALAFVQFIMDVLDVPPVRTLGDAGEDNGRPS